MAFRSVKAAPDSDDKVCQTGGSGRGPYDSAGAPQKWTLQKGLVDSGFFRIAAGARRTHRPAWMNVCNTGWLASGSATRFMRCRVP